VQLDTIADPESNASPGLHADLVDAYHSTSNSGWRELCCIQRDESACKSNSLNIVSAILHIRTS
jgi:hypothetical protein